MKPLNNTLSALFIAIGIAIAGFAISHGLVLMKTTDHYVTVKGLAEKTVNANEAVWQLRFSTSSNDLQNLYKNIHHAQQVTKAFLVKQGFNAKDIQLKPINVIDNRNNSYNNNKIKNYIANSGITLVTNKVPNVQQAVQKVGQVVKLGIVLNYSEVKYLFTKLNQIKPSMLVNATKNAKQAAASFAKNAHSKVKGIRHASQGQFSIRDAGGTYGQDPVKKVRVVTTIQYFLT